MCEVQASFTLSLPKMTLKCPQNKPKSNVLMSFVDNLWSMEISGGSDQSAPLTVVAVKKNGLARRAGIKVGDIITHINNSPAETLTLIDAQLEIHESGRSLKLTVRGYEVSLNSTSKCQCGCGGRAFYS
jgi:S1-C subfamily serine protease